jgi:UMP-CMP kinase
VQEFESQGKVVKVNAERSPDEVYADVVKMFGERGVQKLE